MADLDDLVTADIGIIAFWNALDHRAVVGVGDVDPTDCIAIFDSYDVYDNGIEGYKALGSGRYFHARVKSDGWIIAWIDRTNTFGYPNKVGADFGEDARKGYYDILYDWFEGASGISTTYTTLSYLISLLYNALSNKTDFTFLGAAVGHYCYEYPTAVVISLIDILGDGGESTGNVQYTTGTILHYAVVTALEGVWLTATADFEGIDLISDIEEYPTIGVADISGWMPDSLTNYSLSVASPAPPAGAMHACILIIWS